MRLKHALWRDLAGMMIFDSDSKCALVSHCSVIIILKKKKKKKIKCWSCWSCIFDQFSTLHFHLIHLVFYILYRIILYFIVFCRYLQYGSLPVINPLNEKFPPSFYISRSQLKSFHTISDNHTLSTSLRNPRPGHWFGVACLPKTDHRLRPAVSELHCLNS